MNGRWPDRVFAFLSVLNSCLIHEVEVEIDLGTSKDSSKVGMLSGKLLTHFMKQSQVSSHVSDIWRVDFMIKYEGNYIDTDETVCETP